MRLFGVFAWVGTHSFMKMEIYQPPRWQRRSKWDLCILNTSEGKMSQRYEKSDVTLFVRKAMLDMKRMKAELNEHRYFLERNVEQETAHLSKRIALLESCNAALSAKLTLAHREIAALKQQPAQTLPRKGVEPNDRAVKLYVMNNQAQKSVIPVIQDKWGEHAAA